MYLSYQVVTAYSTSVNKKETEDVENFPAVIISWQPSDRNTE